MSVSAQPVPAMGRQVTPVADTREWHLVTCEYPPRIGGVSDHTFTLAAGLAGEGHRVHVWCPPATGTVPEMPGVVVHQVLGQFAWSDCLRAGRLMNGHSGRRILLQWVPHGYGYKSLNVPFALWIAARHLLRGDELQVMVHEPYMRASAPLSHVIAAQIEKIMLRIISMGASRVWLSSPAWTPFVRPFVPEPTPVEWLPVPAPFEPEAVEWTAAEPVVGETVPVIGHFSTHSPVVTALLEPALEQILSASKARVLLMGRDSERFRDAFTRTRPEFVDRVCATGLLAPAPLCGRFASAPFCCNIRTVSRRGTSMLTASRRACGEQHRTADRTVWNGSPCGAGRPSSGLALPSAVLTIKRCWKTRCARCGGGAFYQVHLRPRALELLRGSIAVRSPDVPHTTPVFRQASPTSVRHRIERDQRPDDLRSCDAVRRED